MHHCSHGSGKSTFLDGLAGRIASGGLQGRVSMDGAETSPSLIKRTSAYIMQDDRLFPMLTVYETLMFAADFRLGNISMADKAQRVEKLIDQLGLSVSSFSSHSLMFNLEILYWVILSLLPTINPYKTLGIASLYNPELLCHLINKLPKLQNLPI